MTAIEDCCYTCPNCAPGANVYCSEDMEPINGFCPGCFESPDLVITEPGVYYGLPAATYHAQHDWLSWSGMKKLIPPLTPAHFKAAQSAAEERKRHFDLGKVVHTLVLGDGDAFEVVQALTKQKVSYDAKSYDLVSAQNDRDRIYSEGKVPILRHELHAAKAMAEQVHQHPTAAMLFADGDPEVSLFWVDAETGVKCRARVDWLPTKVPGRRLVVPDLKTTAISAAPTEFAKQAGKLAYYGQDVHYSDGIRALIDPDVAFVFVAVETYAPHLVSVGQVTDREDKRLARGVVDHCRRLYRDCVTSGHWPGYSDDVSDLFLPTWLHYQLDGLSA